MSPAGNALPGRGISLRFVGWIISIFALVVASMLVVSTILITNENTVVSEANSNYLELREESFNVQKASDYLTEQVRLFVVEGNEKYMDAYFKEAKETKRRENALERIHEFSKDTPEHETLHSYISTAVDESMNLMTLEYKAMKITCEDHSIAFKYDEVANADYGTIDADKRTEKALDFVFGEDYMNSKDIITKNVDLAAEKIDELMNKNVQNAKRDLQNLIILQTIIIVANVVFMAAIITLMYIHIIRPTNATVRAILNDEDVRINSAREYNYMADAYNKMRSQNAHVREKLAYEAEHDKLTGLYNRTGYDTIFRRMRLNRAIFILLDIDMFKEVNDTLGHEMGDKVLMRTADVLNKYFNDDNAYIFRIGGDEFAIIIENADESMNDEVVKRCKKMDEELSKAKGRIPGTTLSIGVAHGDDDDTTDTLFKKADVALYKIKQAGRADVALYEEK